MRKMISLILVFCLASPAALLAQGITPVATQNPQTQTERKQVPVSPDDTRGLYEVGTKPHEWKNHGQRPYFKISSRADLVKMSQLPNLIDDLMAVYTRQQAEAIKGKLARSLDTSVAIETMIVTGSAMKTMIFQGTDPNSLVRSERINVENIVVNTGEPEKAYQFILEAEYGSLVIWVPEVCGNICQNPFPAQVQQFTIRTETQIVEKPVEKIVERQVYVPTPQQQPNVFQDNRRYSSTTTNNGPKVEKKKSRKGLIIGLLLLGIGGGAGAGIAMRGKGTQPAKTYPAGGVISPP